MHLRSLRLRGFKSFPEPVAVQLEPGVAVVVGPNGSGKSNLADAIVWAAGSLSPTELRAEKPEDVLFAGGEGRRPADDCEVELVFSNEDGAGPLPYAEISIARRLERGGEGRYLVNGATVRRADLVELLADVGLGGSMHSIIGQGRVEQILASKPAERRALVEDAAGLGAFKRRRHRAELKLARVATQVERARDLEDEVRKRLRPLALQASAAARAEKLAVEIGRLRARVAAAQLERLDRRAAELEERRVAVAAERRARDGRLEALLEERQRAEEALGTAAERHERATAALYRLHTASDRVDLRRERLEEIAAGLRREIERALAPAPVRAASTFRTTLAAARRWEPMRLENVSEAAERLDAAVQGGADALVAVVGGELWFGNDRSRGRDESLATTLLGRLAELSEGAARILATGRERALRFEPSLRARADAAGPSAELAAELRRLAGQEAELRRAAAETAERATALEIESARLDEERDALRGRAGDEEPGAALADDELDELLDTIARLDRRREALGQVNPLAAEEHARESERLGELTAQREDLERSLAELEGLRSDLDDTVERRFAETYAAVERHFAEVAATLFPGGSGRLVAVEDDDEAGIEVELKPAGKRITRLSLLSGGEKALGAISFLFALFLARPCPFYLLDEVEAALDDTNIGRFVDLLRRFSDRAQFVVVTHQKRTMEAADILYGVTMAGDGVSQIVSKRTSTPAQTRAA